jgi:hypothetical protein
MTRRWGNDPKRLSWLRLNGAHKETHQAAGCLRCGKYKQLRGHIRKGQVAVHLLKVYHDQLAEEMLRRGYNHNSPFPYHDLPKMGFLDIEENKKELKRRGESLEIRKGKKE